MNSRLLHRTSRALESTPRWQRTLLSRSSSSLPSFRGLSNLNSTLPPRLVPLPAQTPRSSLVQFSSSSRSRMSTLPTKEEIQEMKLIEQSLTPMYVKPDAPWGFVIYRVAYGEGTDEKFSRLLKTCQKGVEEDLIYHGKTKTLEPRHKMTVMDDQEKFEGMTPDDVRLDFRSWVVDELKIWLQDDKRVTEDDWKTMKTGEKSAPDARDVHSTLDRFLGARYNICVYVDQQCLDSLDQGYRGIDGVAWSVLKLVWKEWPWEVVEEGEEVEEDEDTEMPRDIDIGWTYLRITEYNSMYGMLCDGNRYDEYCWATHKYQ